MIGELAADSRINKIKEIYNRAKELESYEGSHHSVIYRTVLPAVGLQTTNVTFYYLSEQRSEQENPYHLTHRLLKVKVTYNVAASLFYTIEYLYEQDKLIFYYCKEESANQPLEKRYYFAGGTLIQTIGDGPDASGNNRRVLQSEHFQKADQLAATAAINKAESYRRFFMQLLEAEQLK